LENAFGRAKGLLGIIAGQHDPKAVAVEAADHVATAQRLAEPMGDLEQDPVACLVAIGGIDPA
jgi:hypothetical protein